MQNSLCGTSITSWEGQRIRIFLRNSALEGASLTGHLDSADLLGADLQFAFFENAMATNSRFAAAILNRAKFRGGNFQNADFEGADLQGVTTERGDVGAGAPYGNAYTYEPINLPDVFSPTWPLLLDKDKSATETLELVGQDVERPQGNFRVDFTGANFLWADLRKAHLEHSNITQKQVNEACADETTTLPAGVKPISNENCIFPPWVTERVRVLRTVIPQPSCPLG